MRVEHHVRIGQIKTASIGEVLKTVLGSCVGIGLLVKDLNRYALAHCLLPESPDAGYAKGARYVSHAIPNMLNALGLTEKDHHRIEAIIAGGGHMMDTEQAFIKYVVGDANLNAAKHYLKKYKIPVIAIEPGLDQGTKMSIDCSTGLFEIERIKKIA